MLYTAPTSGLCWWCEGAPADSREHKLKRTDLVRQFGPGPYNELISARDGRSRNIQGPNSVLAKFKATMCAKCNNQRSQPLDLAYDQFTGYIHENEKHVLAEVPASVRQYLDGGPEPCAEMALEFEIRADIAKMTKTALAEGSMWLGDVYSSEVDDQGRTLVLESHYGYRWLRVAWGIGSDLAGYPWPFRAPIQPLPLGPTEPGHVPSERRPFG